MSKLYYVAEKDLMVLSLPPGVIDRENRERIKTEIKENSGVSNVIIYEGEFISVDYSTQQDLSTPVVIYVGGKKHVF